MNKISVYVLGVVIFLVLSSNFHLTEKIIHIKEDIELSYHFDIKPVTLILTELIDTGFLFKTYYMKVKKIERYATESHIIIRTSKKIWEKNKKNIGMSIYRQSEKDNNPSMIPQPPGSIFIGNYLYGLWRRNNEGQIVWKFYSTYSHLPKLLLWNKFSITRKFYNAIKESIKNNKSFYGFNNEFGTNGKVTTKMLTTKPKEKTNIKLKFLNYFIKYIRIPNWN